MAHHTLSVLVENKTGVLARVGEDGRYGAIRKTPLKMAATRVVEEVEHGTVVCHGVAADIRTAAVQQFHFRTIARK